ncbi:MAG: hypothetical protein IT210_07385 [Armatimonadetes bacterium]|nr:hypothetical protein [Armatimonadota bacterium]
MNSRERVLAAVGHRQPDRTPYSFAAMPELYERLKNDLLLDDAGMQRMLGGDLAGVGPSPGRQASQTAYADPTIEVTPEGYFRDIWGVDFRAVTNSVGTYIDLTRNPLRDYDTPESLEDYAYWPSPDLWDYSGLYRQCLEQSERAAIGHSRGFFEISWFLRGMDNFLSDLLSDPAMACGVMDRVLDYLMERMRRVLEAAGGYLPLFEINDDVGSQKGLLVGPDLWRRTIKPRLKEQVALCKRYGARVQYHSCGSVREILPDLIEIGIDILNPVQPLAAGMDPFALKREFGRDIAFHGGIDEQELLPRARAAQVRDHVRRYVEAVGRDGGLIAAPCHVLQPDTPTENVVALYEAIRS